jgi:transposase
VGALLHNLGRKAEFRSKSMTKRTRRNHSGNFKAKVALAALRGDKTLTEIAQHYEVHPNQVTEWKRQLMERAATVFDGAAVPGDGVNEPDLKVLHAKIGQQGRCMKRFARFFSLIAGVSLIGMSLAHASDWVHVAFDQEQNVYVELSDISVISITLLSSVDV